MNDNDRIKVLEYSIKTTTSLCTKIYLESELQKLKDINMKTVCIYHKVDLDGWMSAAIVKHWFISKVTKLTDVIVSNESKLINHDLVRIIDGKEDSIDFIGYNYGENIPDLSKYDKVIMCDISFPIDNMLNIGNKLIWIDHHISAIKAIDERLPNTIEGLRDTKYAACELTWQYFFPNLPMPEIVRLLGRYDCFGHKGTDEETYVLEFQYGARQCITNYELAYEYLMSSFIDVTTFGLIQSIYNSGVAIYNYLCTEAKQIYKNGFEIKFEESISEVWDEKRKFICINKERFNPINFGIDYHKDGYDGCACFWYANGVWNFSLYNDNGLIDCSIIAKQYSGGGHKGASGFVCDTKTFLKIINNG